MGLKIYDAIMICSNKTCCSSFLNAMPMQKSKHAKGKIIHAMQKSKYG
jgi:cell fate regulator YaaT (PSP1 superfamily)